MNILFLDDSSARRKAVLSIFPSAYCVETVQETIDLLSQEKEWDIISLDHDLGGRVFDDSFRPDCGMAVVFWMIEKGYPRVAVRRIILHSFNSTAAFDMEYLLRFCGYEARRIPFDIGFYEGIANL